jgi:murein DD-endopeptidase MepM/ murein hydrolase activator NlpD
VSYSFDSLPFIYQPPVKGVSSSGFGYRMHPIEKVVKFHYGTDFAAQSGDAIYAFADGTVKTAAEDEGYGKYLVISHPGGYETLYAHCGSLLVSRGETVKMGDRIAAVGQTGKATGPHLHFELIKSGVYLNPEFYL